MNEFAIYFLALLSGMMGGAAVDIGQKKPLAGRLIAMASISLAIFVGSQT